MPNGDHIELLSEDIQEVMGRVPPFIIRLGTTFIIIVLFLLAGITWFISYPDTVNIPVTVWNQDVQENKPVKVIMRLPVNGSGRVYPGQTVYIQLDNYPSEEFGKLKGTVTAISPVPVKDSMGLYYPGSIALTNGLLSDRNRPLAFFSEMPGRAEVITSNTSLFQRLVQPLLPGQ